MSKLIPYARFFAVALAIMVSALLCTPAWSDPARPIGHGAVHRLPEPLRDAIIDSVFLPPPPPPPAAHVPPTVLNNLNPSASTNGDLPRNLAWFAGQSFDIPRYSPAENNSGTSANGVSAMAVNCVNRIISNMDNPLVTIDCSTAP